MASEPQKAVQPQATIATAVAGQPTAPQPLDRPAAGPPGQLPSNCGPKDKAAIGAVLETWGSAVINQNAARALSIYAEDAKLKPLDVKAPLNGRPDIRAFYTRDFKARRALLLSGVTARVGCQEAIIVGSYGYATGRLIPTAATAKQPAREIGPKETPFRFTMRLALERGEWLVQEHTLSRQSNDAEHQAKLRFAAGNRPKQSAGPAAQASAPSAAPTAPGDHGWATLVLSH